MAGEERLPGLLHQLGTGLPTGDVGYVAAWSAVKGSVGDVTHRQEVWPQPPYAQLGHVGEGLANTATEQEAPQLLIQARNIAVSNKSSRVHASESHSVTFTQCYSEACDRNAASNKQGIGNGFSLDVGIGDTRVSTEEPSSVRGHCFQFTHKEWDGGDTKTYYIQPD